MSQNPSKKSGKRNKLGVSSNDESFFMIDRPIKTDSTSFGLARNLGTGICDFPRVQTLGAFLAVTLYVRSRVEEDAVGEVDEYGEDIL